MDPLNPLPAWQRRGLYATVAALVVSGSAWLVLHYGSGAGAGELPHPLEASLMRLHGAAGFAALYVAGMLAAGHVPRGWNMSRGRARRPPGTRLPRRSGVALCSCGAALAASGWLLYYCAPETVRPALGIVHSMVGVALGALLPAHAGWWSARRGKAAGMPAGRAATRTPLRSAGRAQVRPTSRRQGDEHGVEHRGRPRPLVGGARDADDVAGDPRRPAPDMLASGPPPADAARSGACAVNAPERSAPGSRRA